MSSKVASWLIIAAVVGITGYVAWLGLTTYHSKVVADAYASGYAAGYSAGKSSVGLKELALQDKLVTAKVCNMWWFGLSYKERVLSRDKDFKDGIGQPS